VFARFRKCPQGGKHKIRRIRRPIGFSGPSIRSAIMSKHKLRLCLKCSKEFWAPGAEHAEYGKPSRWRR
jgi:hypothetical protein